MSGRSEGDGPDVREVVIRALHKASGFLSDPEMARLALSGGDLELDRLELDSLSRFEAMMDIEERLSIEVDDDEIEGLATLDALVAFMASRVP